MRIVEILLPPGVTDKSLSPQHARHIDALQQRMDSYVDKIMDPNTSTKGKEFLKSKLRNDYHDLKSTIRTVTEQGLTELFKPTGNWKWTFQGSEEVSAEFSVGDNDYIFYAYTSDPLEGNWDVEFKIDTEGSELPRHKRFSVTGTGNSAEVFSNVVDIMRSFLSKYKNKINVLTFNALEPSRKKLYHRMVQRLLPAWELSVEGDNFIAKNPQSNNKLSEDDEPEKYEVYDRKTGYRIPGRGPYADRKQASRAVDKLDNQYGGYRYGYRPVKRPTVVKEAVHKLPLSHDDFEIVKQLMCKPIPAAIAPIYIQEIIDDDEFNDLLCELENSDPGRDVRPLIVEWFKRVMPDQLYRFTGATDTMQRKQGLLSPIHGYDPEYFHGQSMETSGNAYGRI